MPKRCKHERQELRAGSVPITIAGVVTHEFIHAWQCLDCGLVTRRTVEYDDMRFDNPPLDVDAWHKAIQDVTVRLFRDDKREEATMNFFSQVISR